MADVSPWVLVFNTLAVGGLALIPQFIEPKKDRVQRRTQEKASYRAIVLSKLEQIFDELETQSGYLETALLEESRRNSDNQLLNARIFSVMNRAVAITATYFPEHMPVVLQGKKDIAEVVGEWSKFVAAGEGTTAQAKLVTHKAIIAQTEFIANLRLKLYESAQRQISAPSA